MFIFLLHLSFIYNLYADVSKCENTHQVPNTTYSSAPCDTGIKYCITATCPGMNGAIRGCDGDGDYFQSFCSSTGCHNLNNSITQVYGCTGAASICCCDTNNCNDDSDSTSPGTTPASSTPKSSSPSNAWVYILCAAIILIILFSILLIFFYRKYRAKKREEMLDFLSRRVPDGKQNKNYTLPNKIDSYDMLYGKDPLYLNESKLRINFENPIGTGVTSIVYRAFLDGPSPLANFSNSIDAKRFRDCSVALKVPSQYAQNEAEQIQKEIEITRVIGYNEHIISMLGWFMHKGKAGLIFELAAGDLLSHVRSLKISQEMMPIKKAMSILWQIAKGMEFLASIHMLHRDLAARNILLIDDYTAKISDFGLSVSCDSTLVFQDTDSNKFPTKWLALESLLERKFSEKSDVWSFGVLMYEMFSYGKVPYGSKNNEELLEFLREGNRLENPEGMPTEISALMISCWDEAPEDRPNFEALVENFRNLLTRETESYGYLS